MRRIPLVLLALFPPLLRAQGPTTAAMHGTVVADGGSPIEGAIVRVTNESNGRRWEIATRSGGRFFFEDLAVGGPYRIDVRSLGFVPEVRRGITLSLGERIVAHFGLKPAAFPLPPITVTANADPVLNSGRVGPTEIVSRSRIAETPNHGRDFLSLTTMSPQTLISPSSGSAPTGGITIAGQHRLLNSFQVDGGTNQDLYTGGLPGRETLPRPISLEAIEEIQVLAAPFDVRYGGFAGGLVNAVTRSGANTIHGSVFGFFQNSALTGTGVSGRLEEFKAWQYGGSVGGPIVRDRTHYFVSLDVQQRTVPDPGPLVTETTATPDPNRVSYADAVRFQGILSDTFNLDAGSLGPVTGRQPAVDVFGSIDLQLGANSHLEVSHRYAHGKRESFAGRRARLYALSSTGQTNPSTANASSLIWTSVIGGRWSSQLIVSSLQLDDQCRPAVEYPAITVQTPGGDLWAGSHASCPSRSVVQKVRELTENLTVGIGSHTVTLGIHGELLRFRDAILGGSPGNWTFLSLDDFAARRASRYSRLLPGSAAAGTLDFRAGQIGLYMQDRWTPTSRLTVTFGLRMDRHFLRDTVATNDALEAALGINTGRLPSESPVLSPRLGINYDVGGGRGYLRGGVGLFAGRVPYVWLANAYRDNGAQELFLVCAGNRVPTFDPVNQPATCASGPGPTTRLSYFDPGLKLPQTLKLALGADQRLLGGVVGTVDVLYSRSLRQFYLTDANLLGPLGTARGEGNRPLYGTINSAGIATPARRAPTLGQVVRISSKSADNALSLSAQLRKRFGETLEASALYAFTRARDQMSLVNFISRQNLEHTPLDGTLENRALRTSYFDVPHGVQLAATARLPHGVGLSLLYAGASGTPYTYVTGGDVNADGMPTGQLTPDIVYVPLDSADITLVDPAQWARLNAVIEAEPCLRQQRGRILARNSCRNPWFGTLNARLSKAFPTASSQSVELVANVYNVPNLVNRRWGLYRVTAPTPAWQMLRMRAYDTVAQRGIYDLDLPILRDVRDLDGRWSRWLAELSIRYVF
jgi:carboxypeptidase family protein/TonB-dependent receptor-like protein